ncbi:unnamed protein product [Mycena citricolor]|uniref:Uncharacterized protein n=1 Tax=Mycena citricolor TaxID=2018698 RepID=A0AAD2GXL0_9AGAR|nr:unnamed protein product [Mycena citricolor]CAK5280917.1 unnamed protein product [Mycena citricolor]
MKFSSTILGLVSAALCVQAAPSPAGNQLESRNLLGEIIDALGLGFVQSINATITLDTLTDNLLNITFEAKNSLPFELTLESVKSSAGINGTEYASFAYTFPKPVVIPPFGSASSGEIPNVLLTQGATAALNIIPLGFLDLLDVDITLKALTIDGHLGIPLNITGLKQNNITTSYTLSLV